ncbi:unnamed protein product [Caenorhabditis angaria]|uniref:Serpentine receptor class gamma n=1 Tax=Caenorhabditis angaria TaxID=860376 RepID=A0A9P1IHN9_9PELO|nr:unnamed protein product [Caenorhabditis angaria]
MNNFQIAYTVVYVTISFVLYFLTIFVILKFWKEFNTSFFRIYVFNFFINITDYIAKLLVSGIASSTCKNDCLFSSWYKNQSVENPGNYPLPTIYTLLINCMFIQYSMIIIISINRFSIIFMFKNIEQIWNTRILPIIFLILPFFPLIITHPIFTNIAYFQYIEASDSYFAVTLANRTQIFEYVVIYMFFSTIISAILNFLSFCRLKKMQVQSSAKNGEKNMLFISFVYFVIQSLALLNFVFLMVFINPTNTNSWHSKIIYQTLDICYDLITLNAPWTSPNYFQIYLFNFFVNTTDYITSLFLSRIASSTCKNDCLFSSWFKNQSVENPGNYPLPTIYTLLINCMFIQYSMIIIISINRFSIIFMFKNIEQIWNTRILPIIFLILPFFPLIITHPIFTNIAYFQYVQTSDSYLATTLANRDEIFGYVVVFMFFSTIISAILNFVSFCRLKKMQVQNSNAAKNGEKNMLFISFVYFIIQSMALINFILLAIYITPENSDSTRSKIIYQTLDFTYDLITLNAPWTLIIFSQKSRKYLMRIFGAKNAANSKNSVFVSKIGHTMTIT